MSADSTEITFVRCPSCRSLVPAASTRCRMCGAKLDTAAQLNDDSKDKARRVRQRTESEEDTASAIEKIRQESAVEEPPGASEEAGLEEETEPMEPPSSAGEEPAAASAPAEADDEDDVDDPLSDYLEDLGDDEDPADEDDVHDLLAEGGDDDDAYDEDDFDGLEDDFLDEFDEEEPAEETPPEPVEGAKSDGGNIVPFAEPDPNPVFVSPVRETVVPPAAGPSPTEKVILEPAAAPAAETESLIQDTAVEPPEAVPEPQAAPFTESREGDSAASAAPRRGAVKPKVVVETGSTRRGGLSFAKKKEPAPRAAEPVEKVKAAGPVLAPSKPQPAPVVPEEKRMKEEKKEPVPAVERLLERKEEPVREVPASRPSHEGVRSEPGRKGRLVGWLVSYSESEGSSIELREGRFFATRNSLKQSDLIIDDPSVSTPHALVIVGADSVKLQDLMSDRGVFHRGRDADSYRKEVDPFPVSHGDWIRFGDVEFLVSLIAYVGMK